MDTFSLMQRCMKFVVVALAFVLALALLPGARGLLGSVSVAARPAQSARPRHGLAATAVALPSDEELAKLFNRLADKYLLLDVPGAGTPGMINCCHGGCDNCDFSRVFDEMSSGRAKWVALYPFRRHQDGREHAPPWSAMFQSEGEQLDKQLFKERVGALPCVPFAMGPPSSVLPADLPAPEVLESFWELLLRRSGKPRTADESLSASDMALALTAATGAEHGALWSDFKRAWE